LQIPWLDAQYFEAPILIGTTITVGVTPNSPIFAQHFLIDDVARPHIESGFVYS
jgi:hypothetical protein